MVLAAYCVMTHLLGVGDRHLENLLLTRRGRLLHVDFAFLLGRDPEWRPPAPPMRITREMIEALGGSRGTAFKQFRQYIHSAYLLLRR